MSPALTCLLALSLLPVPPTSQPARLEMPPSAPSVQAYLASHHNRMHPDVYRWMRARDRELRRRAWLGLDDTDRERLWADASIDIMAQLQESAAELGLYVEPSPYGRPLSELPESVRERLAPIVSALGQVAPGQRWWWNGALVTAPEEAER